MFNANDICAPQGTYSQHEMLWKLWCIYKKHAWYV